MGLGDRIASSRARVPLVTVQLCALLEASTPSFVLSFHGLLEVDSTSLVLLPTAAHSPIALSPLVVEFKSCFIELQLQILSRCARALNRRPCHGLHGEHNAASVLPSSSRISLPFPSNPLLTPLRIIIVLGIYENQSWPRKTELQIDTRRGLHIYGSSPEAGSPSLPFVDNSARKSSGEPMFEMADE